MTKRERLRLVEWLIAYGLDENAAREFVIYVETGDERYRPKDGDK